MTIKMKMLQAAAGAGGGIDIADAFSTDLYTGNGGTQTITNGVDLSGEGGLVWFKSRSNATNQYLFDTARGGSDRLSSNSTNAAETDTGAVTFNSDGYAVDSGNINFSPRTYAAWTFRKAPKFFDVVTYSGTGGTRTLPHDLGIDVGMVTIKNRTDTSGGGNTFWTTRHRGATGNLYLNSTNGQEGSFNHITAISDADFTFTSSFNTSGQTYVAYLFAHDTDDSSVIQCGSYTGNGSATGPVVTLGWEPQWLLVKKASSGSEEWIMLDSVRGMGAGANPRLYASSSAAESPVDYVDSTSTGFEIKSSNGAVNTNAGTYIYMAIRKEGA